MKYIDDRAILSSFSAYFLYKRIDIFLFSIKTLIKFIFFSFKLKISHKSGNTFLIIEEEVSQRRDVQRILKSLKNLFPKKFSKITFDYYYSFNLKQIFYRHKFLIHYLKNYQRYFLNIEDILRRQRLNIINLNIYRFLAIYSLSTYQDMNYNFKYFPEEVKNIFCFMDMNTLSNTLIQVLINNDLGYKCYTTQHGFYRSFNDNKTMTSNEANIKSIVSNKFLCWGNYTKKLLDDINVNNNLKTLIVGHPLDIEIKKLDTGYISVIHDNCTNIVTNRISDKLGENLAIKEKLKLIIHLHPSEKKGIYHNYSRYGEYVVGRNSALLMSLILNKNSQIFLHESSFYLECIKSHKNYLDSNFVFLTKEHKKIIIKTHLSDKNRIEIENDYKKIFNL